MGTVHNEPPHILQSSFLALSPVLRLARVLSLLLLLVLLGNMLGVDLDFATIQLKALTNSLSFPTTLSSEFPVDSEPIPIHAYTCVYNKDWRLVLIERSSPLYLAGTIRHLSTPMERLTLITNFVDRSMEEIQAELAFQQLCKSLIDEGHVVRCQTARVADVVDATLAYYDVSVESFGGPSRFQRSVCPLVATYLATCGNGDTSRPRAASVSSAFPATSFPPSLVVFWEGDVSLVRPGSWLATAAAFSGAHPSMNISSCPCFRLRNRDECASELDVALTPDRPSLRSPWPLPEYWMPFRRPHFSQQVFALPSTSLATIDWKRAGNMPDGACGRFPDEGSYEHRACKWLARWGWVSAMQLEAAYVHTGLDPGALQELGGLLGEQGWPWDLQPAPQ
jgi:hypothetical protein